MQKLRQLFGASTAPASTQPFSITFPGGDTAKAVRASRTAQATDVADRLGLVRPCPVLVIMGGAGKMDAESMRTTRSNLEDGLSRFAEEQHVAVVDGGTTAGVMGLLGFARKRRGYHFPLIGVAPEARVAYPGHEPATKQAELDPNHSHFVLVDGEDFGAESDLLAALGWALATGGRSGAGQQSILGIIINGGAIVKQEAHARATGTPRFPLLVLEGSGRFADELAAAYHAGASDDPVLQNILLAGTLHVLPMNSSTESVRKWLETFFHK